MGILPWGLNVVFNSSTQSPCNPRLTIRCEYTDSDMAPTVVSFTLSPTYGLLTARDTHDWFLEMMREHEEFGVEAERAGDLPMPFWSETVRRVVVE